MDDPKNSPAYGRVLDALDRLKSARIRADNTTVGAPRGPVTVTAALLRELSESPNATPALRTYAQRVASGSTTWDRIEVDAIPVPIEVIHMRADPSVTWPRSWPLPHEDEPYSIPWQ